MTASSYGGRPFAVLSVGEKTAFVAKVLVFACTFGFAYPTILHSDEYTRKFQ